MFRLAWSEVKKEKLEYLTQSRLSSITFSTDGIAKIIQNHDQIGIRMLKLFRASISNPLEIIFNQCLERGTFPNDWKKSIVVLVFKEGDKQILKNYSPISLLPVCGKICGKLVFNEMFKFFIENDLISPNQSSFKSGDSFINQLLSITHNICKSFDCGYDGRGVFLGISKAFDKVWRDAIIYKLEQNGIMAGKLHKLLLNVLVNRKQRVVLNGQVSSLVSVKAWVPQGSILGILLFLIFINDLPKGLLLNAKVFADVTLFSVNHDSSTARNELNDDLIKISNWRY